MNVNVIARWLTASFLMLASISGSGCQTISASISPLFGVSSEASVSDGNSQIQPSRTVTVEFYPNRGRPKRTEVAFQDGMVAEDVLQKTGALRRFRRETIQVARFAPSGNDPVKMEVHYDRAKKQITPGTNYAIHPGDRIMVTQDTTTMVDDLMGSLLGPLARSK